MNEQHKISEAAFFLKGMQLPSAAPIEFQFYLSAFLAAARSVLQYAREEAKAIPGGLAWYDGQVSADAVLRFFKDKRDINIHNRPVPLTRKISVIDTCNIAVSDSLHVVVTRADGTVEVNEILSHPESTATGAAPEAEMHEQFVFSDWPGSEDVIELSREYLQRLIAFVQSGIHVQFVSG